MLRRERDRPDSQQAHSAATVRDRIVIVDKSLTGAQQWSTMSTMTTTDRLRLDPTAVRELQRAFHGGIVEPGDVDYDQHRRIWNGSIDRYPVLIARCANVDDVRHTIRFARESGLDLTVRSGGHSFPGLSVCNDGLVVDLSLMKQVQVDPTRRMARVQAGVRLGELDAETQVFGLAVPAGIVTTTGLAGLTLGGGIGWLMRKYGLTIDQLLSVTLVTADGEVIKASADVNPDLFWAVRGAGANVGVVTEFEFRLNRLGPEVFAGAIFWPIEESANVLRFYRDWITDVPDELTTAVVHRKAPPLPTIPVELHGRPVVTVVSCYAGPVADGERVLAPLRAYGSPLLDLNMRKPFVDHQAMFDPSFPNGWWYYFRSCDVDTLSDEVIDITAEHAQRIRSPLTAFPIFQLGGAVARVGDDETAFHGRTNGHTFNINATTSSKAGFDEEREWSRTFWTALQPHHSGVYVNFLMDEGEERVREAYGAAKYDRLRAIKGQYDPENVFRHNQNIPPA
jgi:FAD/FMN-containing dehydrogenase